MKVIERRIKEVFEVIKEDIPNLNNLTFEISSGYYVGKIHGWYHIGNKCVNYTSIDELISAMEELRNKKRKNELLFRKF